MRWFLIAIAATLAMAACSNGSSSSAGGATTSTTGSSGGTSAAGVSTADVGNLGTVLVDTSGMTLYLFESDTGSKSTCTGSCADTWPPLETTGAPTAAGQADASLLGTIARLDGGTQVTYNGHPVYLYSGDSAPGQDNGEGIGGVWYAVTTAGAPARESSASKSGGGSGYGG
jgi:predicted lipoprotein with Yx(FWY)xxD motif